MTSFPLDALEIATLACDAFSLESIRVLEQLSIPAHEHAGRHLMIVTEGVIVDRGNSAAHALTTGAVRFSAGAETHEAYIAQAPFACLLVTLRDGASTPFPSAGKCVNATELVADAAAISRELAQPNPQAILKLASQTATMMARVHHVAHHRNIPATPLWLLDICDALVVGSARPLRLDALAREAGVHPAHLSRAFRLHFGRTPREYVRELRLTAALAALESTPATISSIAADCGFADHSHLTRAARRLVGDTPSRIRESAQCKVHSSRDE